LVLNEIIKVVMSTDLQHPCWRRLETLFFWAPCTNILTYLLYVRWRRKYWHATMVRMIKISQRTGQLPPKKFRARTDHAGYKRPKVKLVQLWNI